MSSHNSSTVFCSQRIKKFSAKTIRSAAHPNQRDRQKLKTAVTANKKSRRQNLGEIAKKISKAKNRQISIRTVQRVLHEENLRSCIPLKKPLISEKNRKIRFEWAMEKRN